MHYDTLRHFADSWGLVYLFAIFLAADAKPWAEQTERASDRQCRIRSRGASTRSSTGRLRATASGWATRAW